jgi:KDO2-lipid IV(A) lauroyltransferase
MNLVTRSPTGSPSPPSPATPPRWYAHSYNRPGYYRLALAAAPRLPRPMRRWLAAGAARVLRRRFAAEQAAVGRNLARVHPGRDAAWLEGTVRRVFENFGVCFADLLALNRGPAGRLWCHVTSTHGQEHADRVLAGGSGAIFITAHLGNWQLAGRLLSTFGRRVHVVMAPEQDPGVAELVHGNGEAVRFVRRESPVVSVALMSALKRGEVVAFQVDRATGERGDCTVPFFGAPVPFPLGPFVMAAAASVPIVPAFCILEPGGDYGMFIEPALRVARGEEVRGLGRAVTLLERYVAAHADQWFNFFDVWDGADGTSGRG